MGFPLPVATPALLMQAPMESGGLTVSGAGAVLARPDLARLILAVETKNKDAAVAAKANATRLDAVLRTLRKSGVVERDIQTSGLKVGTDDAQKLRTVSNSVEVIVRDLKKVGRLVDACLAAGANTVSSLTFEAKDPTPLYDEALRRAVADARRKARVLATAVKAPIELAGITEGDRGESYAAYALNSRPPAYNLAVPERVATPIAPNKIEVRASVTLRYRFTDAPLREKE